MRELGFRPCFPGVGGGSEGWGGARWGNCGRERSGGGWGGGACGDRQRSLLSQRPASHPVWLGEAAE